MALTNQPTLEDITAFLQTYIRKNRDYITGTFGQMRLVLE